MFNRSEMDVGQSWAYRERAHDVDCPVTKAEILQFGPKKSSKVRIRLLEGEYGGLDVWVPRVRLRVPWDETEAWLQDERSMDAVAEASHGAEDTAEYEAAYLVVGAYPRPDGITLNWPYHSHAVWMGQPAIVGEDLGLDVEFLLSQPLAFIDRNGEYHAPASFAEDLARLVIGRYVNDVLTEVATEERRLHEEAVRGKTYEDGGRAIYVPAEKCAERLHKRQPVFDLVRSWCDAQAVERFDELAALRAELTRLRAMVLDAAERLKEGGRPQVAARLRREVAIDTPTTHD